MEKKKISLKEIGLPKLAGIGVLGMLLLLLTFPEVIKPKNVTKEDSPGNESIIHQIDANMTSYDKNNYITDMEKKLESILSKVSYIGNVEVMITLKASKEQIPLKDIPYTQESLNENDREGGSRINDSIQRDESTVLVTAENGKIVPYIIQELEPKVEGIVVIAEGGDNVKVIKDIMEMAEALFGVPAHKVKVMKMGNGVK